MAPLPLFSEPRIRALWLFTIIFNVGAYLLTFIALPSGLIYETNSAIAPFIASPFVMLPVKALSYAGLWLIVTWPKADRRFRFALAVFFMVNAFLDYANDFSVIVLNGPNVPLLGPVF